MLKAGRLLIVAAAGAVFECLLTIVDGYDGLLPCYLVPGTWYLVPGSESICCCFALTLWSVVMIYDECDVVMW
jgi:hypothetical protein